LTLDSESIYGLKYRFFMVGAIGTFMATLDGSIVNVALPTIANHFGAGVDLVAWVVLAYSLTLMSLMIVFGAWTERRGYAFAYKFGFVFFVVGSTLCALSPTIHFLIAARVVQAVGTAMFAATGPGLITTVFPPKERGKALGLVVMMVAAGFMVGPPLGGYILGFWDWHGLFLINIPIGFLGFYLTQRYFGLLSASPVRTPLPLPGAAAIAVAMISGVYALSHIDDYGAGSPMFWGSIVLSLSAATVFVRQESRPGQALIGLEIFRNKQFVASIGAQLAAFGGTSGVFVLIPFYLEEVRGLDPEHVGLYLVVVPVVMFVFAPLAGKVSDRIGFRLLTTVGMTVTGLSLWMLSRLEAGTEGWYIVFCLGVAGAGTGLFSTPNSSAMMGAVDASRRATASSILATSRNIGMSGGVAVATALFSHYLRVNAEIPDLATRFLAGYRPVIYVAMVFVAIGIAFCLVRNNRYEPATEKPPIDSG